MCRTIAWNSPRSFWIGVPERMIRRGVLRFSNIFEVLLLADFNLCPRMPNELRSTQRRLPKFTFIANDQADWWSVERIDVTVTYKCPRKEIAYMQYASSLLHIWQTRIRNVAIKGRTYAHDCSQSFISHNQNLVDTSENFWSLHVGRRTGEKFHYELRNCLTASLSLSTTKTPTRSRPSLWKVGSAMWTA